MKITDNHTSFGNRRLVGQTHARNQIENILQSGRLSHSYLITGPKGSGKTAFALAMAEVINGIDHLTDLSESKFSKKSSWFTHPDIHVFIPLPSNVGKSELLARLQLLKEDPYQIIDFSLRPALSDPESSKNRNAFYSIDYFNSEIRPKSVYKPNEGRKAVVILTGIDTMRKEAANAFLKLLEEPSGDIIFILTAHQTDKLLPTITSRCQHIRLNPLSYDEIAKALVEYDQFSEEDARFMARISGGNYALTRFYDLESLQKTREQCIRFLRNSYTQDSNQLLSLIQDWNKNLNKESQIGLCNTLEQLLRDILIYRHSQNKELITSIDQLDVIIKFCDSLKDAKLEVMIEQLDECKAQLFQNVQFKFIFTALSLRYTRLMRGQDAYIQTEQSWKNLPAIHI